jgi:hypothetical protein
MPEPILIEFKTDLTQLDKAVDTLEQLGMVDKETADSFRKTSKAAQEYNVELTKAGKTADAVTIDIQDMVKAIKEVPKKIVEDSAKKSLEDTGKAADEVTTKSERLNTKLRALKSELQQMELAGKANTAEYRRMAAQAGALEDQIGDTAARVKILASDTKNLDAALSVATGVAGGFAVAQGAAALFGSENEDVQKALLKVQAALSIVNGLQAVAATLNKDSAASVVLNSTAQKAYGFFVDQTTGKLIAQRVATAALVSGGVALLLIGLVKGVQYLSNLSEKADEAAIRLRNLGLSSEQYAKVLEAGSNAANQAANELQSYIAIARDASAADEVRTEALKFLNEKYGEYLGNLSKENIDTEAVNKSVETYIQLKYQQAVVDAYASIISEKQLTFIKARNAAEEEHFKNIKRYGVGAEQYTAKFEAEFQEEAAKKTAKHEDAIKNLLKTQTREVEKLLQLQSFFKLNTKETEANTEAVKKYIREVGLALDGIVPEELPEDYLFPVKNLQEATLKGIDSIDKYEKAVEEGSAKSKEAVISDLEDITAKRADLYDKWAAVALTGIDVVSQYQNNAYDLDLQNLDKQLANKKISQEQYDQQSAVLKTKQAKRDKAKALFEALINIPSAVIEALPNIPLAIAVGALGAIELGAILAQPIPQYFAEGTRSVTGGTPGKDSVPAYLMPGEGVMPTAINKEYDGILTAIYNKRLPASYLNALADGDMPLMPIGVGSGIDYDLLAERLGNKISMLPLNNWSIDENGLHKYMVVGNNKIVFLNQRYSS